MTSTPAAQVRKEPRNWLNRLAVAASRTYRTWTRLPVTPSPSQTTPLGPTTASAVPGPASGVGSAAGAAPPMSESLGPAVVSRSGTPGAATAPVTGATSCLTSRPGGGASGPCVQSPGPVISYPPMHSAPFFAGVRPLKIRPTSGRSAGTSVIGATLSFDRNALSTPGTARADPRPTVATATPTRTRYARRSRAEDRRCCGMRCEDTAWPPKGGHEGGVDSGPSRPRRALDPPGEERAADGVKPGASTWERRRRYPFADGG